MAKQLQVKVPDIGDYGDVPVIEVLVKVGDQVEKEDPLITLESDKATLEVPAPQTGTVASLSVKEGDKVSAGSVVLVLDLAEDAAAGKVPKAADAETTADKPIDEPVRKPAPAQPPVPDSADAAHPTGGTERKAVTVPDIGDFSDVPVIEVLVKVGDHVEKEDPLITLESDKATLEVPAPMAGTIHNLKLKEGDTVNVGDTVCEIETARVNTTGATARPEQDGDAAATSKPAPTDGDQHNPPPSPTSPPAPQAPVQAEPHGIGDTLPHASPSVRKFARELGVDLARIQGSGLHQRILREDVQDHVKQALKQPQAATGGAGIPAIPQIDFAQFGAVEYQPLARIRKLSAAHLHRSWLNLPHVTQTDDADITDLEAFRHAQNTKRGTKLTLLPIILKVVAKAIDRYPEFASSLDGAGENLVMKHYRHIGFAADTPNGLVVPVVRDVDRKGIMDLAKESAELAGRARDGKLKPDEMKGGVFSVSSLGGIGGGYFTPIINAPEVAILGVSRAVMRPLWDGEQFRPRLILPLSLSYDHRVIDGANAARFIVHLVSLLSDLRKLSL